MYATPSSKWKENKGVALWLCLCDHMHRVPLATVN